MVWQSWLVITVHPPEQRKCHFLGSYLSIHPWTLHCSPLPLHMEEGSRSFAVWWRCVLTQWGDEDGILIGLIELMVLSPLVGEECQASRWLFASWLLFACCSYTLALTWTVSLCLRPSLLSSMSTSLSVLFSAFSLPFSILYHSLPTSFSLQMAKSCFSNAPLWQMSFVHSAIDFIKWLWSISLYIPCVLAGAWFVNVCAHVCCLCLCVYVCVCLWFCAGPEAGGVCVIMEGWHLKQCI